MPETIRRIGIHGVPRSGTSWLGEIFNSSENIKYLYQPLFSYAYKNFLNNNSMKKEIDSFFKLLHDTEDDFILQTKERYLGIKPQFSKKNITHLVYKEVRYHNIVENMLKQDQHFKACFIIRNPLAVLNSWFNAPREFRFDLGWNIKKEWMLANKKNNGQPEEYYGYAKWKEASTLFHKLKELYPSRVYLLSYQDLIENPSAVIQSLFKFFSVNFGEQTRKFIFNSTKRSDNNVYSVYKIKKSDADWEENIDSKIVQYIKTDLLGTHLEQYL